MTQYKQYDEIIILANGEFPTNKIPLNKLMESNSVICCDGAANMLIEKGKEPIAIVGDLDSLSSEFKERYKEILIYDSCQETNDLTKAFKHAIKYKPNSVIILGATGKREDHTLGNISLLFDYSTLYGKVNVSMWSNYGYFNVIQKSGTFNSSPKEQLSFFSLSPNQRVISKGLLYPLDNVVFDKWWKATLNESAGDSFTLELFNDSPIIVFSLYNSAE